MTLARFKPASAWRDQSLTIDFSHLIQEAIIGLLSGGLGGYIGIRVAIARLQVWQNIRDGDIARLERSVGILSDDSSVYNQEIGVLCNFAKIQRIERQRNR